MKSKIIIHPILFAVFPVVMLYFNNIHFVAFSEILLPLAIIVGITIPIWFVLRLVLKDNVKNEPSLLRKELMEIVRNGIGPIATPQQIYFVTKLPKTRSGKIMRRVLKAIASNENVGDISTLEDSEAVMDVQNAFNELQNTIRKNKD